MLFKVVILTFLITIQARATELYETNISLRSLGMGGVYGPIVEDSESLYFNTANLGRLEGIRLEILNLGAGVNGVEAVEQLSTINSSNSSGGLLDYVGSRYWVGAIGRATFAMPYFGFGAFNHTMLSFKIQNPVLPEFEATYLNDTVVMIGGAFSITKNSYLGVNLKQIKRVGGSEILDSATLLNSSTLTNLASQFSNAGEGYGFAL
nr:hypothetical protein [Pseudobdellovibrionaceae bacterium]